MNKPFCLIFPKPFEAASIMMSMDGIKAVRRHDHWTWEVVLKKHKFYYKIINESDFMFYQKLSTLDISHQYLLVGSCGCLNINSALKPVNYMKFIKDKHNIIPIDELTTQKEKKEEKEDEEDEGLTDQMKIQLKTQKSIEITSKSHDGDLEPKLWNYYIINEATKYDRGELPVLNDNNVVFISDPEKQEAIKIDENNVNFLMEILKINQRPVNSCNFLMNATLYPVLKNLEEKFVLFDMETYDFIRFCGNNNINLLGVIRIISDIIGNNQKFTRCQPNMRELSKSLIKVIERCAERTTFNLTPDVKDAESITSWRKMNIEFIEVKIDKVKSTLHNEPEMLLKLEQYIKDLKHLK